MTLVSAYRSFQNPGALAIVSDGLFTNTSKSQSLDPIKDDFSATSNSLRWWSLCKSSFGPCEGPTWLEKNTCQRNWFHFKLTVPPHGPSCYPELLHTTVDTCARVGHSPSPHTARLLLLSLSSRPCFLFHRQNRINQKTISACAHQAIYLPAHLCLRPCGQPALLVLWPPV